MRIGVIGAGTMGSGIAQLFAASGFEVVLTDQSTEFLERGMAGIRSRLAKSVDKGKLSPADAEAAVGRIRPVAGVSELSGCGLLVECIREDRAAKAELFAGLGRLELGDAIIASNTSALSITELAMQYRDPARVIGMHFFNPVEAMALVEVIRGLTTSDEVLATVLDLARQLGKTPIQVEEAPGFVVNRLLIPLINEAIAISAEGIASPADIDTAMKLGANHPMGPLELGDLIGLDVCLAIMETLHEEMGDDRYRPHPLLRKMVRGNRLGRKTKQGFFSY